MSFFRRRAAKRPKNSRDGIDDGTPKCSMGVLNDKETIEVPGESWSQPSPVPRAH